MQPRYRLEEPPREGGSMSHRTLDPLSDLAIKRVITTIIISGDKIWGNHQETEG